MTSKLFRVMHKAFSDMVSACLHQRFSAHHPFLLMLMPTPRVKQNAIHELSHKPKKAGKESTSKWGWEGLVLPVQLKDRDSGGLARVMQSRSEKPEEGVD